MFLSACARRYTALFLLLFLVSAPSQARLDWQTCGTLPSTAAEVRALHERNRRNLEAVAQTLAARRPSVARDIGHIAVLEDRDGVVARRNLFNLSGRTVRFLPQNASASAYRFVSVDNDYSDADAFSGTPLSGLDDDDTRRLDLPFAFPFFGKSYQQVYVNSDGNLTFTASDTDTSERSFGRFTSGPPRIAGLFEDLDPSRAPDSVRVLAQPSRVVLSWVRVPEFASVGTGPLQTFQVRLFPDGHVEYAFQSITLRSAVVGIAPGSLTGESAIVSFRDGSDRVFDAAVGERFTDTESIDIVFAAQKFFESHEDAYDYLAIYNNLGIESAPGAIAFEVTVRSDRLGIGDDLVDQGKLFGSPRRLQAVMNLGPLGQYPRDPNQVVPGRTLARDTPLTILGHEAGHLFLAFASVRDPANPNLRPMLGRQSAHWSFTFNSEASLLEGNRIRDDGPGANPRFATVATVEGYSALDQYLMGLRSPDEVAPTFLVTNATAGPSNRQPQAGVVFNGDRRDITVEEVIRAEGRRTPDHTAAQRRFRFGFILVVAAGVEPPADQVAQLEVYRANFEAFFERSSGARATADASLKRSLQLSTFPAAGLVAGARANTTIRLQSPPQAPLTVFLRPRNRIVSAPGSVTIPAGQLQATFEILGDRPGVEELFAEPADDRYETVHSRITVQPDSTSLRVEIVSGNKQAATSGQPLPQPVTVRSVDINNVPYAGIALSTAGSGTVEPASAVTDSRGEAAFRWTPGPGSVLDLHIQIAGFPASRVTATALGQPFIPENAAVNAASFRPGLPIGGIGSIFGANMTGGIAAAAASLPLAETLGGVRLLIDGRPAPLYYVSDRQINFIVPARGAGSASLEVVSGNRRVAVPHAVPMRDFDPGIFFSGDSEGAILHAGTGQTTLQRPAAAGDVLEIYSTGLGPVVNSSAFAGLQETVVTPTVLIGGLPATVRFSGLSPAYPGLYQVNAAVPAGLAAGPQEVQLFSQSGVRSNTVRIRAR